MTWLREKAEQPEWNGERFPEQWRGRGQGQSSSKDQEVRNLPGLVGWGRRPSNRSLRVPGALPQVRSGDVPGEAGSGSPVASCLDKHASAAPADCPLHRAPPGSTHTGPLFFLLAALRLLLPIPAPPSDPSTWPVGPCRADLGLSALTESRCSASYFPYFEGLPSSRNPNQIWQKGQSMDKDFQ